MKNIRKIIAIVLSLMIVVTTTTGCDIEDVKEALNFHSNLSLTLDISTGDQIKAELDTSDGLSMSFNDETNHLEIKNEEKDLVLECAFMPKDSLEEYVKNAEDQLQIHDVYEENGLAYTLCSYRDDNNDKVYEIIGWVIGTNTGILADGTDSKLEMLEILRLIWFSCENTDQNDNKYYPDFVLIKD